MNRGRGQSSWISLSDLMTGLVLVFLVVIIANQYSTLARYENTKKQIFNALENKFADEIKAKKLTVSQDLVVRFLNVETLFERDKAALSDDYKGILDDFIPRYLDVLQDENFANNIIEVRIEGHTGGPTPRHRTRIQRVRLSQARAREVLKYFFSHKEFRSLHENKQEVLRFKFMANGFGDGRKVDKNGDYVIKTGLPAYSTRRVEFRIMTDAESRLREALGLLGSS